MKPAWKRLSTGRYVDLNNFHKADVDLKDIENSLNLTYRFNGHGADFKPLTVAQHSWLCLSLAEEFYEDEDELYKKVFIHDFAEAYIGDVATPVKKALGQAWYDFADPIENAVNSAFLSSPVSDEDRQKIKMCDLTSLDIERRCMWKSQLGKDKWPEGHKDYGNLSDKNALFKAAQTKGWINLDQYLYRLI